METPLFHNKLFQKMCLYQIKLRNIRYMPNEKNQGNPILPKDKRHLYINTDCGWCIECRKKIANNWRIRVIEENKAMNKEKIKGQFVTLSFSPAAIKQLCEEIKKKGYKGLKEGEIDVNDMAAYAIRMWSERWRKKRKKAPKHWLITELGHKNSERIHLHGIIWDNDKELIKNTWKYGNIYIGEYVNEKTINYITKYITKLDEFHKGYKQRIFVSKGIGKEYLETTRAKEHKFKGENTKNWYTNSQGYKIALPRYYKDKIYNAEEKEQLWTIALDKGEMTINKNKVKIADTSNEELKKIIEGARLTNENAGYGNQTTCNKKYIITNAMTTEYEKINYNKTKIVKCVKKRKILGTIQNSSYTLEFEEGKAKTTLNKVDKSTDVEKTIYGEYIGNTTKAQRDYNELLKEAQEQKITVRQLRLKKKGLPY